MKVGVIQFLGTNCEYDTKYAFELIGAKVDILWHKDRLSEYDLVVLPGGFSYGDYLRSGAIAKFAPIMNEIKEFAKKGGKVLGICNGFQILTEARLLPGALKRNENLHFISKFQYIKVINNNNAFLNQCKKGKVLNIPIAHHDGNYFIDEDGLKELEDNGQILLKYCDKDGNEVNINGSVANIAGITNKQKNIFGLMPHPERACEKILSCDDGIKMIKGFLNKNF